MATKFNFLPLVIGAVAVAIMGGAGGTALAQQVDYTHAQNQLQSVSQHQADLLQDSQRLRVQAKATTSTATTLNSEVVALSAANPTGLVDASALTVAKTAATTAVRTAGFTVPAVPAIRWGAKNPSVQQKTEVLSEASKFLAKQNITVAGEIKAADGVNASTLTQLTTAVNSLPASAAAFIAANPHADAAKQDALTAAAKSAVAAVGDEAKFNAAVTVYSAAGADVVASQAAYVQAQQAAATAAANAAAAARAKASAAKISPSVSRSSSTAAPASTGTTTPAPVTYHVNVRTAITADGAPDAAKVQNTINAGGQVAIDYQIEGITDIAAHNYVDSTALKLQVGNIVVFSGAYTGTYRVTNAIYVQKGTLETVLSTLGTPLVMQTCEYVNNQMRLVGLVPVN